MHKYFTAICSFKSKIYLQNKDTIINIDKPRSILCSETNLDINVPVISDVNFVMIYQTVFLKIIVIDYHQLIFMYMCKVTLFFFIEKAHIIAFMKVPNLVS